MSSEEVTETVAAIDAAMRERGLFRDAELNLAKLARRLGLPADKSPMPLIADMA